MSLIKTKSQVGITASPMADAPLCKFTVDHLLYDGSLICKDPQMAQGSPLLEHLFAIPEVHEVLIVKNILTVAAVDLKVDWKIVGKKIGEVIRSLISEEVDLIPSNFLQKYEQEQGQTVVHGGQTCKSHPKAEIKPDLAKNPVAQKILQLIELQINPAVASHGGRITLVDFKDDTAYVRMEGGCQGCGQASLTLRQGVEQSIKQSISEVKQVIDLTDHASGSTPYY